MANSKQAGAIEPPTVDERWGDTVEPVDDSDWDREFWLSYARDVHNIDEELLEDKPTTWIIGRVNEEPNKYRGDST